MQVLRIFNRSPSETHGFIFHEKEPHWDRNLVQREALRGTYTTKCLFPLSAPERLYVIKEFKTVRLTTGPT